MFICKNELFLNFEIILELSSLIKQVSEVLHEHLLVLSSFVSCQNVYKADLTNDWSISNLMKVHSSILRNFVVVSKLDKKIKENYEIITWTAW